MAKGQTLILLDTLGYKDGLTRDDEVRCQSYLIKYIKETTNYDQNLHFEVYPVNFLGGFTPMIACSPKDGVKNPYANFDLDALERDVNAHIAKIGLPKLLELCHGEALTWEEVLKKGWREQVDS